MSENEQCVICKQFNDQMLMLQCVHDPCINCAAIHYAEQFKGKLKNYYYTCQLCGERTALDISSVIELEKLAPKRLDETASLKKPMYRDIQGESTGSLKRKFDQDLSHYRDQAKQVYPREVVREIPARDTLRDSYDDSYKQLRTSYKQKAKVCKDHPEEQVSYYCFKCLQNICPQCAIHGAHQGHQVKAVKKAIVDVRKQFSNIVDNIGRAQSDLKRNKEQYSKKIKDLSQQTIKQKGYVSKQFETMRNYMMSKEREYLKELDEINHRNGSILTTQTQMINRQIEDTHKLIRSVQQTLKKDDISILEEFSKKNQSYTNQVEKMSVSQVGSSLPGLKSANLSDLKQIISVVSSTLSELSIRTEDVLYNSL